jgi:microcystin-dependent protein
MSQPFIGEIRMFGGNFAPNGWMLCQGQLLAISDNDSLFNLIGTTYGGDGQSTFALPNLQSRLPIHQGTQGGTTYSLGQSGGVETVTLSTQQIPIHSHPFLASTTQGALASPVNNVLAASNTISLYKVAVPASPLAPQASGPAGGSQPHDNLQPYLCINFIISLFGIFPSQN